jgi:hypothetical protein
VPWVARDAVGAWRTPLAGYCLPCLSVPYYVVLSYLIYVVVNFSEPAACILRPFSRARGGSQPFSMVQVRSSIFWPRCASDSPSGFVIGWNPHSFMCSIATVVSDMRLDEVERVLAEVAQDLRLQPLMQYCGGPPTVLGVWQHPADAGQRVPIDRSHTAQLWLSLVAEPAEDSSGRFLPSLREVYCCGCRYRTTLQLTLFERGGARSTRPAEPNEGPLDCSSAARGEAAPRHACAAGEETQSAVERTPSALEYVVRHVRLSPLPLARGCGLRPEGAT